MIKNVFICSFIALMGMFVIGIYSAYITKKTMEESLFEKHIKNNFFELSSIEKKDYNELLFLKSTSLFGSIIHITQENFHPNKVFCNQLNIKTSELILKTIEKKVSISPEEKKTFNNKFQILLEECKKYKY